jgi:hypothetical protein
MPPDSWCGYSSMRCSGDGDADLAEHVERDLAARSSSLVLVQQDGLDDLVADGVDRVERGHRLLKDHR